MPTTVKEGLLDLVKKVNDLYKEMVTNTVQFEELRKTTKETIVDFKHIVERLGDKVENIEKEFIESKANLLSKIDALDSRLTILSEEALHQAVKEAAILPSSKDLTSFKKSFLSPFLFRSVE